MIKKIRQWLLLRKDRKRAMNMVRSANSQQQLDHVYMLGYNDGKRDGLAIAREQAIKSVKEIIWQQNQNQK